MAVIQVNKGQFKQEVLEHKGVVFVDYYANWCRPCKMTEPIIHGISEERKNIKFIKVNVDESPELASEYSVFSIPTFLIFKDGKIVHQFVGAMGKEGFISEIKKATGE
jgi:thioredoxin 1